MENKLIDVADILRDCSIGMKLDCTIIVIKNNERIKL